MSSSLDDEHPVTPHLHRGHVSGCDSCTIRETAESNIKECLEANEDRRVRLIFQYRDYKHKTKTSKDNNLSDHITDKHWEDGWLNMITMLVGPINDLVRAKDADRRMKMKHYGWCEGHEVVFSWLGSTPKGSTILIDCKPREFAVPWKPTAEDPLWLTLPDGSMKRNPKAGTYMDPLVATLYQSSSATN